MAISLGSRQAADEEARAEVEVLNSRLEKTSQLTKKIQASLSRLESSGKSVQEAVGPLYGNTQKLQTLGTSTYSQIDLFPRSSNVCQILTGSLMRSRGFDNLPISRVTKRMSSERGTNWVGDYLSN